MRPYIPPNLSQIVHQLGTILSHSRIYSDLFLWLLIFTHHRMYPTQDTSLTLKLLCPFSSLDFSLNGHSAYFALSGRILEVFHGSVLELLIPIFPWDLNSHNIPQWAISFCFREWLPYTEMSLAQGLHYFKWWLLFIGCFLTLLEIIYHWQTQIYVTLYCVSFPSWPPCFLMHTQSVGCTRTRTLSFFCLLSSKAKTIIYRLWDQMFVDWIQLPRNWYVRCKFNSCWCSESCFSVKKL